MMELALGSALESDMSARPSTADEMRTCAEWREEQTDQLQNE
jgi:hypothetical protein